MHPRKSFVAVLVHISETNNILSAEATSQTDGFANALTLAFDDPSVAEHAYEQFQDNGTIPAHGRGPWVVFMGRQPGVFTS